MDKLTFYIPDFGNGGLERMFVNLANEVAHRGIHANFIVGNTNKPYLHDLDPVVELRALHSKKRRSLTSALANDLLQNTPDALITAKDLGIETALAAKRRTQSSARIYIRVITNMGGMLKHRHLLKRLLFFRRVGIQRQYLLMADGIIAVSQGIADDLVATYNLPQDRIAVAHNPVVTSTLLQRATGPVDHPWLQPDQPPVILGIGRVTRQKNFSLLLAAFARVRRNRLCRLIIIGNGERVKELTEKAKRLGVHKDVDFLGFTENPYAYLSNAALFVLSSSWEGSPNALTEALAVGCPVVATDCPSGPRETLRGGAVGPLVPVEQVSPLAEAIETTLDNPLPQERLQAAAAPFSATHSADEYLRIMGFA